jgi:hypothetical protein
MRVSSGPRRGVLAAMLFVTAPVPALAQQAPPLRDESPFRRLELPAPNRMRTAAGAPGPAYWQQRADYVIRATLDTVANTVTGSERITYHNNSPDTLRYLWLQLDQNLFARTSRGAFVFGSGPRTAPGPDGGITLTRVALGSQPDAQGRARATATPLRHEVVGTMMRVDMPRPLVSGARVVLELEWSFQFPSDPSRMGMEVVDGGTVYEVAQWYPRMAVYDDVEGWNTDQYYGQGEFHLEFGSFDVSLTLPANMLVAATGTLRNAEAVLTAGQRARLAVARASDTTVAVRSKAEIADPASRPRPAGGRLTWRFTADSVRDFAWAAARHFIWDAARANGGRTLAMSFYPPSADSIWKESTQYVKFAVENYSRWLPYPYPVAINVNGIEGGMEYPMIVFCHNRVNAGALFSVTDHEIGHTWFPMIVSNNERLYPWMDEGFNTFQNYYNWEKKFPGEFNRRANLDLYLQFVRSGAEQPAMTPADRIAGLGQVAYNKPGLGLRLLRDRILGPERFDRAFVEYVRRWAYRHPTPADFFRTMEDGTGEDLSWFWRGWFYTTGTLDQAVDSVAVADSAGLVTSRVYLRNAGELVMPVDLELSAADGTKERMPLPVEIWFGGPSYLLELHGRRVASVSIDPDNAFPDVRRDNNAWGGRR